MSVANVMREVEIVHNVISVHGSLKRATVSGLKSFNGYIILVQAVNQYGEGVVGETSAGW